jgi:hypothetical protein
MAAATTGRLTHPTLEKSCRFPLDMALRAAGWRIHARPRRGQPLWERDGVVLPELEAAKTLRTEP